MARYRNQNQSQSPQETAARGKAEADMQASYAQEVNRIQAQRNNQAADTAVAKYSPSSLPPGAGTGRQSAANIAETARRDIAGRPFYKPGAGQTTPGDTALNGKLRGSTPEEIAAFQAGDPASPNNPTTKALTGAAGTGATVATPYGTASSRTAKPGEATAPLTDTGLAADSTGPKRDAPKDYALRQGANGLVPSADATAELAKSHPEVFVPGSPENQEFVKQWGDQTKGMKVGDQFQKHGDIATSAVESATPVDPSNPDRVAANPPKSAGQVAGEAVRNAPATAVTGAAGMIKSALGPAMKYAGDFVAGATGREGQQAGINPVQPGEVPAGGTQSPKQIADASARSGLQAQTAQTADTAAPTYPVGSSNGQPVYSPDRPSDTDAAAARDANASTAAVPPPNSDAHADIHAATVKAIANAGQNAHDAINAAPQFSGSVALNPTGSNADTAIPGGEAASGTAPAGYKSPVYQPSGQPMGNLQSAKGNQSSQNVDSTAGY